MKLDWLDAVAHPKSSIRNGRPVGATVIFQRLENSDLGVHCSKRSINWILTVIKR